jgi:hypothetical protein
MTTFTDFYGTTVNPTNGSNSNSNCSLVFDPSLVTPGIMANGVFTIQGFANDSAGNSNSSLTNITGEAVKIYASSWNMFTFMGANNTKSATSESVSDFINKHFSYATQISVWSNVYGNFTTYSISTPTINNGTLLSPGNATYIYSTVTDWYIQPDYVPASGSADENITLYINGTVKNTTSWNQMGLLNNVTMNSTLYACTMNITGLTANSGNCPAGYLNITYVSWFNASANQYVTCKQGFSICSGGVNPANIVLPKGSAVWILPNGNITINRTMISGG